MVKPFKKNNSLTSLKLKLEITFINFCTMLVKITRKLGIFNYSSKIDSRGINLSFNLWKLMAFMLNS